ncbi:MAG: hypothetical protein NTW86_24990 [Candidatus Sumerlaeota bacterium]|nr:hypothetical protein [Candidatus Sumerlaeota bacterium]
MKRYRKKWLWSALAIGLLGSLLTVGLKVAGQLQTTRNVTEDKASLRAIAAAIEDYAMYLNFLPATLEQLRFHESWDHPIHYGFVAGQEKGPLVSEVGPFLKEVPRSAFRGHPYPHYQRFGPDRWGEFWIAWYPGPDGKFDFDPTGKEDDVIRWVTSDFRRPPDWILDRMYDPTNGSRHGDIIRWP